MAAAASSSASSPPRSIQQLVSRLQQLRPCFSPGATLDQAAILCIDPIAVLGTTTDGLKQKRFAGCGDFFAHLVCPKPRHWGRARRFGADKLGSSRGFTEAALWQENPCEYEGSVMEHFSSPAIRVRRKAIQTLLDSIKTDNMPPDLSLDRVVEVVETAQATIKSAVVGVLKHCIAAQNERPRLKNDCPISISTASVLKNIAQHHKLRILVADPKLSYEDVGRLLLDCDARAILFSTDASPAELALLHQTECIVVEDVCAAFEKLPSSTATSASDCSLEPAAIGKASATISTRPPAVGSPAPEASLLAGRLDSSQLPGLRRVWCMCNLDDPGMAKMLLRILKSCGVPSSAAAAAAAAAAASSSSSSSSAAAASSSSSSSAAAASSGRELKDPAEFFDLNAANTLLFDSVVYRTVPLVLSRFGEMKFCRIEPCACLSDDVSEPELGKAPFRHHQRHCQAAFSSSSPMALLRDKNFISRVASSFSSEGSISGAAVPMMFPDHRADSIAQLLVQARSLENAWADLISSAQTASGPGLANEPQHQAMHDLTRVWHCTSRVLKSMYDYGSARPVTTRVSFNIAATHFRQLVQGKFDPVAGHDGASSECSSENPAKRSKVAPRAPAESNGPPGHKSSNGDCLAMAELAARWDAIIISFLPESSSARSPDQDIDAFAAELLLACAYFCSQRQDSQALVILAALLATLKATSGQFSAGERGREVVCSVCAWAVLRSSLPAATPVLYHQLDGCSGLATGRSAASQACSDAWGPACASRLSDSLQAGESAAQMALLLACEDVAASVPGYVFAGCATDHPMPLLARIRASASDGALFDLGVAASLGQHAAEVYSVRHLLTGSATSRRGPGGLEIGTAAHWRAAQLSRDGPPNKWTSGAVRQVRVAGTLVCDGNSTLPRFFSNPDALDDAAASPGEPTAPRVQDCQMPKHIRDAALSRTDSWYVWHPASPWLGLRTRPRSVYDICLASAAAAQNRCPTVPIERQGLFARWTCSKEQVKEQAINLVAGWQLSASQTPRTDPRDAGLAPHVNRAQLAREESPPCREMATLRMQWTEVLGRSGSSAGSADSPDSPRQSKRPRAATEPSSKDWKLHWERLAEWGIDAVANDFAALWLWKGTAGRPLQLNIGTALVSLPEQDQSSRGECFNGQVVERVCQKLWSQEVSKLEKVATMTARVSEDALSDIIESAVPSTRRSSSSSSSSSSNTTTTVAVDGASRATILVAAKRAPAATRRDPHMTAAALEALSQPTAEGCLTHLLPTCRAGVRKAAKPGSPIQPLGMQLEGTWQALLRQSFGAASSFHANGCKTIAQHHLALLSRCSETQPDEEPSSTGNDVGYAAVHSKSCAAILEKLSGVQPRLWMRFVAEPRSAEGLCPTTATTARLADKLSSKLRHAPNTVIAELAFGMLVRKLGGLPGSAAIASDSLEAVVQIPKAGKWFGVGHSAASSEVDAQPVFGAAETSLAIQSSKAWLIGVRDTAAQLAWKLRLMAACGCSVDDRNRFRRPHLQRLVAWLQDMARLREVPESVAAKPLAARVCMTVLAVFSNPRNNRGFNLRELSDDKLHFIWLCMKAASTRLADARAQISVALCKLRPETGTGVIADQQLEASRGRAALPTSRALFMVVVGPSVESQFLCLLDRVFGKD